MEYNASHGIPEKDKLKHNTKMAKKKINTPAENEFNSSIVERKDLKIESAGNTPLEQLENGLQKIREGKFKIMFYVVDSKGSPQGSLANTYITGHMLMEAGYNVLFIYQDEQFTGVKEWLGEKYASIPHANILTETITIGVSDFLVIPETMVEIQNESFIKKWPCKRIVFCQQFSYLFRFMPPMSEFGKYGIKDVITTSHTQCKQLLELFPYLDIKIIKPSISPHFYKPVGEKDLSVAIVTKDQGDAMRIISPFYLKYPVYRFVSFMDLRNFAQKDFAEHVRKSAILVWMDNDSCFGYTPLESIRCGTVTIAKLPDTVPEWAYTEENGERKLTDAILWADTVHDFPDIIASVVRAWMEDRIPVKIFEKMEEFQDRYTREEQQQAVIETFKSYIANREQEITETIDIINRKENTENQ
jgi:hypothetical protein